MRTMSEALTMVVVVVVQGAHVKCLRIYLRSQPQPYKGPRRHPYYNHPGGFGVYHRFHPVIMVRNRIGQRGHV